MYKQMPLNVLKEKSQIWKTPIESDEFARKMDDDDQFASFRDHFTFPKMHELPYVDLSRVREENENCIYLCGQSLGLKPKSVDKYVKEVLNNWGANGVHSHFHGYLPAALCDLTPKESMSRIVGAKPNEVTIMNALTVNLHLLLCTFYRPTQTRYKILIEDHAFPSDMYVVKSQLRLHDYSPETSLITLKPRKGEHLLREEDILDVISQKGDQIMVALLPSIQYYTGQLLNISKLTSACHDNGIIVGVDCAHAVGNVPLYLHNWNVDFAAWCTYKYVNSGAGGVGAIFVHEKYIENGGNSHFPMLQGWWGNNLKTKFLMKSTFEPSSGADMFKLSNPSPVLSAMLMASLDIFSQTSIEELQKKQFLLTGYLEYMLMKHFPQISKSFDPNNSNGHGFVMPSIEIITPNDPKQRGAQLSMIFSVPLAIVQEELQKRGVVCDIRMPSVMRVAPIPLYNSFTDVYDFVMILRDIFKELSGKLEINNAVSMKTALNGDGDDYTLNDHVSK